MRVLRVYHAGRDRAHRARERALAELGVEVTLVVPSGWPDPGSEGLLSDEPFQIVELPVRRPGDVNGHLYADRQDILRVLADKRPDVLDLHEEPVSLAARQWLRAAGNLPVTMYTAQNVDKRFPPPFAQFESAAFRRVDALYPCTRQAASVARGKGFTGPVRVLPLGVSDIFSPGRQTTDDVEVRLGLVGRLVPEKGVRDAVRVLARLRADRRARLVIVGQGPELQPAQELARELGVASEVEFIPWQPEEVLATLYRTLHVVLVPSRATETWVEQFGRIIVEGQASGAVVAGYASGAITEIGGPAAVTSKEGDWQQLAASVRALLSDRKRFDRLREVGISQATVASWPSIARAQSALYGDVVSRSTARAAPVRRSALQRERARTEFGPAATLAGDVERPFAVPILRRDATWTRGLGRALDRAARLAGR